MLSIRGCNPFYVALMNDRQIVSWLLIIYVIESEMAFTGGSDLGL